LNNDDRSDHGVGVYYGVFSSVFSPANFDCANRLVGAGAYCVKIDYVGGVKD